MGIVDFIRYHSRRLLLLSGVLAFLIPTEADAGASKSTFTDRCKVVLKKARVLFADGKDQEAYDALMAPQSPCAKTRMRASAYVPAHTLAGTAALALGRPETAHKHFSQGYKKALRPETRQELALLMGQALQRSQKTESAQKAYAKAEGHPLYPYIVSNGSSDSSSLPPQSENIVDFIRSVDPQAFETQIRLFPTPDSPTVSLGALISAIGLIESGNNANIKSKAGAVGLFQIMAATANNLKVPGCDANTRHNERCSYLMAKKLLQELGVESKELLWVVAAYNIGAPRMQTRGQALARAQNMQDAFLAAQRLPWNETRGYVAKVAGLSLGIEASERAKDTVVRTPTAALKDRSVALSDWQP